MLTVAGYHYGLVGVEMLYAELLGWLKLLVLEVLLLQLRAVRGSGTDDGSDDSQSTLDEW